MATEANLKKKRKAFEEERTTNHWPHLPKLFGKKPRTYGKEILHIQSVSKPTVNELGKRLAGYTKQERSFKSMKFTKKIKE